jgi:hypothetical protein
MKRVYTIILTFLALMSCRTVMPTEYTANPANVADPISVMKNTIQQQPAAYAYLEIDDKCIILFMESSRLTAMPVLGGSGGVVVGQGGSNLSPEYVCYKNIGRISLSHIEGDDIWRIEIDDKRGNYMYWVYTYERSEAERFIDAIYNFVELQH